MAPRSSLVIVACLCMLCTLPSMRRHCMQFNMCRSLVVACHAVLCATELVTSLLNIINREVNAKKSLDANLSGAFKRAVQLACDERRTGSNPTSRTVATLLHRRGGLATLFLLRRQSQS